MDVASKQVQTEAILRLNADVVPDINMFLRQTSREQTNGGSTPPRHRSPRSDEPFNRLVEEITECYYEKKRLVKELKKQCDLYNEKTRQLKHFANKAELEQL